MDSFASGYSHKAFLKFPTLLSELLLHSFLLLSCIPLWGDDTVPLSIRLLLNTLVAFSLGLL